MDTTSKLIINLDQLHENIKSICSYKKGCFMFVLKSNAYGFGYKEIAEEIEQYEEVKFIGVALPNEAIYIKKFTTKTVVVLGYTHDSLLNDLVENSIVPTVFEGTQIKHLPKNTDVFINIDTGFNRLGANQDEFDILMSHPNINVIGVFTHLRLNGQSNDFQQEQLFSRIVKAYDIPYISISDSIGFTRYMFQENLYRIGASLFGYTSYKETGKLNVKEIATLKTMITRTKKITEDTYAFYRSKVDKGQTIATIQLGYGDGLFRTMSVESYVVVNGHKCKYIEVGMDQSIIDITGINASTGDEVIIFGEGGMTLGEYASKANTNKNNILTMIQKRVVREYVKHNKVIKQIGLWEETYESR